MNQSLAPGSLLQHMYFKRRLRSLELQGGFAYEFGAGNGNLSKVLLDHGMTVKAFDLNPSACLKNEKLNRHFVSCGRFEVECANFLQTNVTEPADLILSSMVIEHLPEDSVRDYFAKAKSLLTRKGVVCTFAPGSPRHWGIEDEIAGHYKRYTFECFSRIAQKASLKIRDLAGLTYPISNWLLGISNNLVRRSEAAQMQLSKQDRTIASGDRNVPFKTTFPSWVRAIINERTLYPFHLLQCCARRNPSSLVIYCEMGNAPTENGKDDQ